MLEGKVRETCLGFEKKDKGVVKVCQPANISVTILTKAKKLIYLVMLGIGFAPESSTVQDEGKKTKKQTDKCLITDFRHCFGYAILATEYLEDKV